MALQVSSLQDRIRPSVCHLPYKRVPSDHLVHNFSLLNDADHWSLYAQEVAEDAVSAKIERLEAAGDMVGASYAGRTSARMVYRTSAGWAPKHEA